MILGLVSEELSLLKTVDLAIVCNGLKVTGGGTSPSIGLISALCSENPNAKRLIYSLVRPSVTLLNGSPDMREVSEAEVVAQSEICGLTGFMVGPFSSDHRSIDTEWCSRLVQAAKGKEVWLHNGIMLLPTESLFEQLKALKECGVHGIVAPLHGDTLAAKIEFAKSIAKIGGECSLKVIVTGDIDFQCQWNQVKEEFASMREFVIGIAIPIVISDQMHGQLLDWRLSDVCSNLFAVRNQWRPSIEVALEEITRSAN